MKNKTKKMLIGIMCALSLMAFDCSRAEAAYVYETVEPWAYFYPQKIRCTCYFEHRGTATLRRPYFGIAAGQKDWLGYIAEVNRVNPDGSVGEFIGFFEFRDTGAGMDSDGDGKGDTIINGTSIDIWVNSLEDAYAWVNEYGDYVYIKLIKAKG